MEPIKIVIVRDARPIIHDKRGPAGRPAGITIGSVTTGEPGSAASVTNSGTTANVVLDFAIPEGVPGTTSWNGIVDKPVTVSGYGITDAATLTDLAAHTTSTSNPHAVTKAQVGLGNVDNTSDAGKPVSSAQASADSAVAAAAAGALSAHTTNTANPHAVTKAQVGLGNVDNTSDAGKPVSTAQASADSAVAATAAGALSSHSAAGGTAHPVATPTTAGFLAPADKTKLDGIATGATANSSDAILRDRANHTGMQASSTITGLDSTINSLNASIGNTATLTNLAQADATQALGAIATHTANTSNPHAVTKAQVGLGNVDNTSDANKPVSTAQATALAGKQPLDGDLTAIAGIASNGYLRRTGASTWTVDASIPNTSISGLGNAAVIDWAYGGNVVSDPGKLARYAPDASLSAAILIAKRIDGERGLIGVENANGFSGVLSPELVTAHRYHKLPDADGTVALVASNIGQIALADVATFSSATLRARTTDSTGTGALVFSGGNIGAANGLSLALTGEAATGTVSVKSGANVGRIGQGIIDGFTENTDIIYQANGGIRFCGGTTFSDGAAFQAFGGLGGGELAGQMYFDSGSNQRTLGGRAAIWRNMVSGGLNEVMRLSAGSNMLIGTSTDNGARFQVAGTMTVSGAVTLADQLTIPGQAASTPSAAMTRALTEEIAGMTPIVATDLNSSTTYNGSNQVNRWFFQSAETPQGGDITPTAVLVKGMIGPKLTVGNGTSVFAVRGGDTEPRTILVVCRALGSGSGFGRFRHRSWNLFANSGVVTLTVGSGGSHRNLASGAWDNSKVIVAAWSGNTTVTRGGLWHNGALVTGNYAGPVNYDSNGGQLVDLGAGAGGAAGDIEIAAIKIFGGCATEAQIRALLATEAKLWI